MVSKAVVVVSLSVVVVSGNVVVVAATVVVSASLPSSSAPGSTYNLGGFGRGGDFEGDGLFSRTTLVPKE